MTKSESKIGTTAVASAVSDKRRQRSRSLAIAGSLIFLAILFYLITLFKMGSAVLNKGL